MAENFERNLKACVRTLGIARTAEVLGAEGPVVVRGWIAGVELPSSDHCEAAALAAADLPLAAA